MDNEPHTLSTRLWGKLYVYVDKICLIKHNVVSTRGQPFREDVLFHLKFGRTDGENQIRWTYKCCIGLIYQFVGLWTSAALIKSPLEIRYERNFIKIPFFSYIEYSFHDVPYGKINQNWCKKLQWTKFPEIWVETEMYFLH